MNDRKLNQLFASARQVPEFSDRPFGNEAWSDHAMAKQVRKPAAVIGISLVAAPVLNIIGIGQNEFNAIL